MTPTPQPVTDEELAQQIGAIMSMSGNVQGDVVLSLLLELQSRRSADSAVVEKTEQAVFIPMNDCCLSINTGRDGTWLHFSTSTGLYASINVENMAGDGGIIKRALLDWCKDRRLQADALRARDGGE